MFPPIRIMPIVWAVIAAGGLVMAAWLIHIVRADAKAGVKAEFAEAARKKNVDIGDYNSAEEAIDAIVAANVQEALARSKAVPSTLKYTAEQAQAINAIRQAGGR